MKLKIQDGRAKTDSACPPQLLTALKRFEGRANLLKTGQLSFASSPHNISLFLSYEPDTQIEEEETTSTIDWEAATVRPTFREKREGRFWQVEASQKIKRLIENPKAPRGFAFFFRPGGGKSKSLTDMAMMLYCAGEIDACIILPPNMLVAEQWVGDHGALNTDVQDNVATDKWLWAKTKKAQSDYDALLKSDGCQFISMNIDAAKTPKGFGLLSDFIAHHKGRVLFAVDESHLIKTPSSGRYKKCTALGAMCNWRAILTGTPITKNLVDAWAQFKFLDERILGYRYVTAFKNKFCEQKWNGFANEVIGHKNVEEFYRRIEPFSTRVSESEMGLKKIHDEFEFKLSGDQKRHFDDVKEKWLTALDNGEFASATIALTAAIKMHQISSGYVNTDEGELVQFAHNARLEALQSLIETLDDDKLVIWCRFKQNATDIMKALGDSAIEISGNIDKGFKTPNKDRFVNDSKLRFMVATPDAAGTGLDGLQSVCNRAIFYNTNEHYVNRIQAEDRILRIGGQTTAFYHDLICKGSSDRRVLRNLLGKKELSKMTLDEVRGVFC